MLAVLGYALLKIILIVFVFAVGLATLLTWVERKQSALIQDRLGPSRANIGELRLGGLLHIVADGIKSFTKEDFVPDTPNPWLFKLAPILAFAPAIIVFAVIPFGPSDNFLISSTPTGMLFIFAVLGLSVYGTALAGWASNSPFALLGALRAAAQMVSYEVALGLSVVGIFLVYGSVGLQDIVVGQGDYLWGVIPKWGIVTQPLAFVIFLAASIAETKRGPFDMPEGESEIVAGYFTEYSSMRFAMFALGEFIAIVGVGAVGATLFLGGWQIPWIHGSGPWFTALQIAGFLLKIVFVCWLQLMLRWSLPRFRYDQVMTLGWKVLMELALVNILATAALVAALN